jgi:hypothetical protein
MVRAAPRYDPRIREAIAELDRLSQPIAETCRRVGARAEELGLTRPSHVHLRQLVAEERERKAFERDRRKELRQIAWDVYWDINFGKRVDPWEVEERVRNAGRNPT